MMSEANKLHIVEMHPLHMLDQERRQVSVVEHPSRLGSPPRWEMNLVDGHRLMQVLTALSKSISAVHPLAVGPPEWLAAVGIIGARYPGAVGVRGAGEIQSRSLKLLCEGVDSHNICPMHCVNLVAIIMADRYVFATGSKGQESSHTPVKPPPDSRLRLYIGLARPSQEFQSPTTETKQARGAHATKRSPNTSPNCMMWDPMTLPMEGNVPDWNLSKSSSDSKEPLYTYAGWMNLPCAGSSTTGIGQTKSASLSTPWNSTTASYNQEHRR
eukprot:CAMPEP_0178403508 /NCGR_PEP_ID=MMETSP0689_2-20121128/17404_1 /TAXON_ID=160604 /ORGANISM="Amphidinium massartii, Strain CS-259" /LENGTH=269 /DNA_ID=CAMNT_0020024463 /DNA_START=1395 /DNA_END=2205 /DNA_ORIENTATION=-